MTRPREAVVAKLDDLRQRGRIVVDVDGAEFGLYIHDGQVRAWWNVCPHQGGPVCQGKIMPRTVQLVREDHRSGGLGISTTQRNIVCPWHGYEFDMLTGRHPAKPEVRLRAADVRIVDGEIVVLLSPHG